MKLFINVATVFGLDDEIIQQTINIRKSVKIKTPDAIIAATGLVKKLTVISRNTIDFKKIDGLKVIDPHQF